MADNGPKIDPKKAEEIQNSAMEPGWQPGRWKNNIYEALGISLDSPAKAAPTVSSSPSSSPSPKVSPKPSSSPNPYKGVSKPRSY